MSAQPPTTVQPPTGNPPYLWQQLPPSTRAWEMGPLPGTPFPAPTFPAGHYLGG